MLPVGVMYRADMFKMFGGNKELFKRMNPSMFVAFKENEVKIGVTKKPVDEDSLCRGKEAAPAVAVLNGDEGCVILEGDERFKIWKVEKRRVTELCAGVNMGRSMCNDDGTYSTRVLGSAKRWANALLYSDHKDGYPTLVGETTSGREVLIALACNSELPGFLLWAYNSENAQTMVTPVDIPARLFEHKPPVNDPRVKVLSNKHVGGDAYVLCLRVFYTCDKRVMRPTKSYVDDDGCLCEEYAVARAWEVALTVQSLAETKIYAEYVACSGEITPEDWLSLEKFWGTNVMHLKTELSDTEDHEGWELSVQGPDGRTYPIYKVMYRLAV